MTTRAAVFTPVPPPAQYDAGYVQRMLQGVQQAIPSQVIRTLDQSVGQLLSDRYVVFKATQARTYTLLAVPTAPVFAVTIKNAYSSSAAVTVTGTIDGATNLTLAPGDCCTLIPDPDRGTWVLLNEFDDSSAADLAALTATIQGSTARDMLDLLAYAFERIYYLEQAVDMAYRPGDLWVPDAVALLADHSTLPSETAVWMSTS